MPDYDLVIVGSGFGAAVMAARLGRAIADARGTAASVLVLERGNDHHGIFDLDADGPPLNEQGNRFRHSLAPEYLADVGEVYTDPDEAFVEGAPSLNVLTGKGIGGGSNLYLAVSLRAPTEVFEQTRDGARRWPARYSRAALDPWYAVVEDMLHVRQMAWTDAEAPHWALATRRDAVFAEGCRRIGATAVPLKLAIDEDPNEGWWSQGQRYAGRQGLAGNYLLDALAAGVTFHANCEVDTVEPVDGGYRVTGTDRRGEPGGDGETFTHTARMVIVAAGTIGTAGILLRSAARFPAGRELDQGEAQAGAPVLGKRLSGNGDYGVHGVVGEEFAGRVTSHRGKPMSSFCPSFWRDHQFVIIPFYAQPLYLAQGQPSTLLPAHNPAATGRRSTTVAVGDDGRPVPHWGAAYKERLAGFVDRHLSMGCLTLDDGEGEVVLGPGGASIQVRWPATSPATEARWSAAVDVMRRIYEALGGEMFLDSYRKDGTVNTAHPLSSAPMSDDPTQGIVDDCGECHANPDLFVVDGAIVPSSLGVNPSLTIAAVAESIADRLVRGDGTRSLAERLGLGG